MAKVIRNLFKVYIDTDWKVTNTIPAPIAAFGNGQTSIRIVSAEASPAEYTGILTFILASGQEYTGSPVPILIPNGVEEVNGEDWFVWDYPLNKFITSNSSKNADGTLYFTSIFTNISDTDNVNPQIPQSSATISASTQKVDVVLSPDDVQNLTGMIQQKRNINPSILNGIDFEDTNIITVYNPGGDIEFQGTLDELKEWINEASGKVKLLPTNTDSEIVGFKKNVNFVTDAGYNVAVTPITVTATTTGVFEKVKSFVAPVGFLDGTRTNTDFATTLQAMLKAGSLANVEFRLQYVKRDSLGDETEIFAGLPLTISTVDFNTSSKLGTITTSTLDADAGDRWVTNLYIKATNIGDGVTFNVGGANPVSFTQFNIEASTVNQNKLDKLFGALGNRIVVTKTDGTLLEIDLQPEDIQLISNSGVTYPPLVAGKVPNSFLDVQIQKVLGTFGSGASTTGGDLPGFTEIGNSYRADIDYVSIEAGLTFTAGDYATFDNTNTWRRDTGGLGVTKVNDKVGPEVTLTKADVGLSNADNTSDADKPISTLQAIENNKKMESIQLKKEGTTIGNVTKLNFVGGVGVTIDGGDAEQGNINIIGEAGLVGGQQNIGEVVGSGLPSGIPTTEIQVPFTLARQAVNTDVLEVDADNNQILLKEISNTDGDKLLYRLFIQPTVINGNTGTEIDTDFIIKLDGVEQARRTRTVAEASVQADGALNPPVECYVETDPNGVSPQILTVFIEASATGADLTRFEFSVNTAFVISQSILGIMFENIYDTLLLEKVDKAQLAEKQELHQLTATVGGVFNKLLTGVRQQNNLFYISLNPAINGGANAQFSFDGESTLIDVYDRDGVTQLLASQVENRKLLYLMDGTKFILLSNDLELETKALKELTFSTTIATGDWTGSSPATATKAVIGILATDDPIQDLDLSSVAFVDIEDTDAEYVKIYLGTTTNDQVVFSALETPTKDLIITLKVGGR